MGAMDKIRTFLRTLRQRRRGQGLVEFALMFPVLLIMLSGLMEFGFLLNEYLDVLDAAREAARFASDNNPFNDDYTDRQQFYDTAADLAMTTMLPLQICVDADPGDGLRCGDDVNDTIHGDVVISVFGVAHTGLGSLNVKRYPRAGIGTCPVPNDCYWSRFGTHQSQFTMADVVAMLDTNSPNTGIVLVEVYFEYDQKFKLPWITAFLPDPVQIDSHTIMPLVAAEPTATPVP